MDGTMTDSKQRDRWVFAVRACGGHRTSYAGRTMVRMWLSVSGATSAGVRRHPLAAAASGSCIISERVHAKRRRCGVWVLDASPAHACSRVPR